MGKIVPSDGLGCHRLHGNGSVVSWSEDIDITKSAAQPVGGSSHEVGVFPLDSHNAKLLDAVAPKAWVNPTPSEGDPAVTEMYYDLVAIGAGAGGLVSAKQSARRGARSAIIERHLAGGDCLNVGCVPSKGLIRCARNCAEIRRAKEMGSIPNSDGATHDFDLAIVMERMRKLRAQIAPADALQTSTSVGAACFFGSATFTSPRTLRVNLNDGGVRLLHFGRAVIATGGSARVPPIEGLSTAPYHTNATLFNITSLPKRMVVIGAGPIGLEMAQAFALFGTEVTCLLRSDKVLGKEDPDAATIVRAAMEKDGVNFVTGIAYKRIRVSQNDAGWTAERPCLDARYPTIEIDVEDKKSGEARTVACDCLLVATGRSPNVEGLNLEAAGVKYTKSDGVVVNDFLETTAEGIYAVGDVCSKTQFTHVAGTHAQMVVQNALFGDRKRVSDLAIPWVTFTEPEVAHVGAYEHELRARGEECDTYTAHFNHNDRAILEGAENGFVRIHCRKGTEEIVGGTIVAPAAGEMISELTVAIQFNVPLGASGLGSVIHSYPTMSDGVGGCAFGCKMKNWEKVKVVDPASTELVVPKLCSPPKDRGYSDENQSKAFILGLGMGAMVAFMVTAAINRSR